MDGQGVVRISTTRIPLDTVVDYYNLGQSAEEIHVAFPTLQLRDIYSVIAYYLGHRDAVDSYVDQNRRIAAEIREQIETRSPQAGLRERLLARRSAFQSS